nr:hypothetical protein [Tanacetum cinerariifolium]
TFRVILPSIHSDEWKSFQNHHQTALRIRQWRYNLTPAESKFKTPMLDHQDKYMMKAQDDKGISICQEQYTRNLLKKYDICDSSLVKTPMVPPNNLGPDLVGKPINETSYMGMIRCLEVTPTLSMYYLKCPGFDLKGYSDSDYVGCNMDRKSTSDSDYAGYNMDRKITSGACQILGVKLVCWSAEKQQSVAMSSAEAEYVAAAGCCASILWMKDPFKVTEIELIAHMIVVNNRRDSVSPPPLVAKPKKGKSQTITLTSPKSQDPEALRALSKNSKRRMSKKPPTKTKRDIQLASTRLPFTLDEGTQKSQPLLESTDTHPKDSRGNKQPLDRDITFTTPDEGTTKTTMRPKGSRGDKDSGGNKLPADMEPQNLIDADLPRTSAKYHEDQTQSSRLRYQSLTENEGEPSYERELDTQPMILSMLMFEPFFFLRIRLRRVRRTFWELVKKWMTILSLMKPNISLLLLREKNPLHSLLHTLKHLTLILQANPLQLSQAGSLQHLLSLTLQKMLRGRMLLTLILKNLLLILRGADANIHDKLEEPKQSKDANMFIGSSTHLLSITHAQPITIIHPEPSVPQREGKGIATDDQAKDKKMVKASSIVCPDPDEPVGVEFMINEKIVYLTKQEIQEYWDKEEEIKKAEEKSKLNAISKTEVIKVVREEAKKLVYRGTDGRNFNVHKPFLFRAFGISKLDELREIIPKKKNTVVKELMNCNAPLRKEDVIS